MADDKDNFFRVSSLSSDFPAALSLSPEKKGSHSFDIVDVSDENEEFDDCDDDWDPLEGIGDVESEDHEDEFGRQVDWNGHLLNEDGDCVDETGRILSKEEAAINKNEAVREDYIDESGNLFIEVDRGFPRILGEQNPFAQKPN